MLTGPNIDAELEGQEIITELNEMEECAIDFDFKVSCKILNDNDYDDYDNDENENDTDDDDDSLK